MRTYLLICLLLLGYYGTAQQALQKNHYSIINKDFEFTLPYEKALEHTQLDNLRYLDSRRQVPVEGTKIIIELFSAQELFTSYGKPISPFTAKKSVVEEPIKFKLSANNYFLLTTPNSSLNEQQTTTNIKIAAKETVTNFGSTLFDSGGANGNYADNETYVRTIYSDNGESPYLDFNLFSVENHFDVMYIYDGPNATSELIGAYTGGTNPKIVQASGSYLTVVFISDGSNNRAGWSALVGRGTPHASLPSPMAANTCAQAAPFCANNNPNGITFPASTDGTNTPGQGPSAEVGPSYGCLSSTPNPAWYYLQVANSGNLVLTVAGSLNNDVDFICWGPFTSPTAPCTASLTGSCAGDHSCTGNIVDCSYSTSATETCTIPNGIVGQYYLLLITNFEDMPQNINLNQTGGTGSTNCNIVSCGVTATNTGPYCVGATINLNAATTNTTATTYAWAGPGGYSAIGQSVTIPNSTLAMSGTYSVTGTTGGTVTCVATTTVTVATATPPTVASTTICAGSPGTLTATGTATSYTWSTGATTATMTDSPVTTTVYTVTGSVGTCTAAATATITAVTYTPTATPTVTSATICAGSPGTLTATGAATSYTWSTGATTAAMTASPLTTTVYTVTGSVGTCTATTTATITAVTYTPTATPTVTSTTICAGSPGTLTATGAATSYTWNTGATTATMTASPLTTTVYTVTGSVGTCTAATTATITAVTYTPTATPTVTPVTICAGATGTLTATGSATSYTWSTGATTATITDNPAATMVYTVTGSVGTCTAAATATITVVANPTLATVNSNTICLGNSVTLATSGATTYSWSPATGLSSTNTGTVTANPTNNTTTYTITGTAGTCSATPITTTVTVVSAITPTVTSNTPCATKTLTINCNPGGYIKYLWSGPGGYSSVAQNPTIPGVAVAASGTYTLVVTDAAGCINSAIVSATVNPLPFVVGGVSPACLNFPITFSATPGFASYAWSGPGGYTSSSQAPIITNATYANQGSYTVTVVDGITGCTNSNSNTTDPIIVIVNSPPTITVTNTTVCVLTTGTLTANSTHPNTTYSWTPSIELNTNIGNPVLVTPSVVAPTIYTITGQDANGCVDTTTAMVNVNGPPTVNILPAVIKGCTPQSATYTATSTSGVSDYNWSFGNGQSSTTALPSVLYSIAGTYMVKLTLTDANNCKSTATASVIAYPVPVADFNYTPDPASILDPTVTFLNATSGVEITNYSWNFGDSLNTSIDTTTTPQHTYLHVGSYPVTLIVLDANGCSDTVVKMVIIEQDFALFVPNSFTPNGDGKNEIFKAEGEGITDFKMYIFDRWGNKIFTTTDINIGWDGRINDKGGESLSADVYVWKIDLKNVSHQGKTYTGTVTMIK
jgi:gliding motility-associated-like protein